MIRNNLLAAVYHSVSRFADKDALRWKEDGVYIGMSYKIMWENIRHLAAGLARLGIANDDKVAILSENRPQWPIADLAIQSLGGVTVPVYPSLPADQVEAILQNAEVKAIFVEDEHQLGKVRETAQEGLHAIVINTSAAFSYQDKSLPLSELIFAGKSHPLSSWEEGWKSIDSDHLATIIHTSGTTGKPKGAMLTHGNFLSNINAIQFWCIEAGPSDTFLSYLPLSHVLERMAGQFTPLSLGATIAYAESIEKIPTNLLEVKPTIMTTVPRLLEKVYANIQGQIRTSSLLKKKLFHWAVTAGMDRYDFLSNTRIDELILKGLPKRLARKYALADRIVFSKVKANLGGRLRALVSGGAALNPEIASLFWSMGIPVLEGYGLTETSPVIALNPAVSPKVGTVGRVLANLNIKIAEDGEILVKGPSIMKGYYRNPEATAEAFADDWFRTGDIGSLSVDGYLTIVDRKKRLLILSTGKNIAPQHIENAMNQSSYIENSVVVGHGEKYIIAVLSPDGESLREWARKQGIEAQGRAELISNPLVKRMLEKEVKSLTSKLASFEQPKNIIIAPDQWTVENGFITPSLKVKSHLVENHYKASIAAAYEERSLQL
ncbi:AMP-dependent synthetase/ligase [Bacillus massilinigeriensis]|uniref:AMP-dependent synthetase/ligase n=1 Tax=Bacillus mediterraneensis TaxID=1805474 RepID=UPI0008F824ED|nr:long-chain fatty acid--CoA ligase [Bacillus mediterraneensis]